MRYGITGGNYNDIQNFALMALSPPPPVFTLRSTMGQVTTLSVFRGQKREDEMLSGHITGDVQLWDLKLYRPRASWQAHPGQRVQWVGAHDGRALTYGRDGYVHVWVVNGSSAKKTGSIRIECCTHCPCDINVTCLVTPSNDTQLHLWELDNFSNAVAQIDLGSHVPKCGMITAVKFVSLPGMTLLLVGCENGSIAACNVSSSDVSQLAAHVELVTCMDFDTSGMRGVSGSADDKLVIWQMSEDGVLTTKSTVTITNPGVACVGIHPRGRYMAAGGWDHRLRVFSWKKLKPLAVIDFHLGTVNSLSFILAEHRYILAAGSQDGRISLWDLYNSENNKTS